MYFIILFLAFNVKCVSLTLKVDPFFVVVFFSQFFSLMSNSGDDSISQQQLAEKVTLDVNKEQEKQPAVDSSASLEEQKPVIQIQQPEISSSPPSGDANIPKREDDDEDENENQQSALKHALQEEKEIEEVEDLYSYKLDAEWFKQLERGIALSQEKSQVLHFNEGNNKQNEHVQQQQQEQVLEPFAQQCLHLFSGEWTTLKATDLYEKVLPEDNQYVCIQVFLSC